MDTQDKLKSIKSQISEAKSDMSRLEGKRDSKKEELKKDFGIDTVEEGKKRLAEIKGEREKVEEEMNTKQEALEAKYEFE